MSKEVQAWYKSLRREVRAAFGHSNDESAIKEYVKEEREKLNTGIDYVHGSVSSAVGEVTGRVEHTNKSVNKLVTDYQSVGSLCNSHPTFVVLSTSSAVFFPALAIGRKAAIYGGFVTMVTSTIAVGFLGWAYRRSNTPASKRNN